MENIFKLAYKQNPEETIKFLKQAFIEDDCENCDGCPCDFLKSKIPKDFINDFLYLEDIINYNDRVPINYIRENKDKFNSYQWISISKWISEDHISEFKDYVDLRFFHLNKNISLERLRDISSEFENYHWQSVSKWIPNAWIPEFKDYLDCCILIRRSDISFESIQLLKNRFIYDWDVFVRHGNPDHVEKLLDEIPFDKINNLDGINIENLRIVKDKLNKYCWDNIIQTIPEIYLEEFKDYIDFKVLVRRYHLSDYIKNKFKVELDKAKEELKLCPWGWS